MDAETTDAVLAEMAYRIVANRRRDMADSIARRLLAKNGSVSADEVKAALDVEWVEPPADEILNLVARKCATAVDYHEREITLEASRVDRAERRVRNAEARLAEAQARLDQVRAAADESAGARAADDARALLAAVQAAGGDEGRAPVGADAAASAEVAEAVGEAIGPTAGG